MKIAVVGSRRMSSYGREAIGKIMEKLKGAEVVTIKIAGCNSEVIRRGADKIFAGQNFEKLNEEVADYADKLVIIEGGRESGTLLLAEKFVSKNKPVYALPGRVGEEGSWAPNWLIAQGAIPITEWENLTEILQ